jgi:benzoyl-CoA reductase subunit C
VSTFDEFHEIVSRPHKFALDWKERTGGKVLGYLCSNLPEELVYAAGVLPVRMLGANEPETVTGPYIFQAAFCSFARDCLAQALQGRYSYIDGLAYSACCPHINEVFYDWRRYVPVSYSYELRMPSNLQGSHTKKFLTGEIEDFKHSLEDWTGKIIHVDRLDNAIEIYNTNRNLMAMVYEMMKADNPPISAATVAEMALSGMLVDKQTHNTLLRKALDETTAAKPSRKSGPRLLLLGSVNSDLEIIRFIESLGGNIVADDYCTGSRYYQAPVVMELNRLAALATREMVKTPCPLKDLPVRRRPAYYGRLVDDYRVRGVIYALQRQCDPHGLDYPVIEQLMKDKGIPMLRLELDYTVPVGQLRTRIEAFLEMLAT